MRNPIVGEFYRHKSSPNYGWAKVLYVLDAKQYPNNKTCKVAKCEWVAYRSDNFGLIKFLKTNDLIKN